MRCLLLFCLRLIKVLCSFITMDVILNERALPLDQKGILFFVQHFIKNSPHESIMRAVFNSYLPETEDKYSGSSSFSCCDFFINSLVSY